MTMDHTQRVVAAMHRATADQLRAERAAAHLTIEAAARASGLSRSTIMRLESGERPANVDQIAALGSAYGLGTHEILTRAYERTVSDGSAGRAV